MSQQSDHFSVTHRLVQAEDERHREHVEWLIRLFPPGEADNLGRWVGHNQRLALVS
jgi:hypothetical protein